MAGLNKVMIIGNLGADPEMRYTADGTALTSFRVASSRNYSGRDGERHEETEWFSVVTWQKLAEQLLVKMVRFSVKLLLQLLHANTSADCPLLAPGIEAHPVTDQLYVDMLPGPVNVVVELGQTLLVPVIEQFGGNSPAALSGVTAP